MTPIGGIIDRIGLCQCGNPERYVEAIHYALKLLSLPPHGPERDRDWDRRWQRIDAWLCSNGNMPIDVDCRWLLLYCLDGWDLTEHGGSIGAAWLTEDGEALLQFLDEAAVGVGDRPELDAWRKAHDEWLNSDRPEGKVCSQPTKSIQ